MPAVARAPAPGRRVTLGSRALDDPDPWHGLSTFLDEWPRLRLEDRGLTQIFTDPDVGRPRQDATRGRPHRSAARRHTDP